MGADGQVKVAVVERREVSCDKDVNESFSEESDHPANCQFLQGTPDDDIQSLAQILCEMGNNQFCKDLTTFISQPSPINGLYPSLSEITCHPAVTDHFQKHEFAILRWQRMKLQPFYSHQESR